MIFIDSNVVIDLVEHDPDWSPWSIAAVSEGLVSDAVVFDSIVLAECAGHFDSVDEQLRFFEELGLRFKQISPAAAFRAGTAHRAYRRAGGARSSILADFLIAAHASVLDAKLLTRDRRRFASYFPELTQIAPEIENG